MRFLSLVLLISLLFTYKGEAQNINVMSKGDIFQWKYFIENNGQFANQFTDNKSYDFAFVHSQDQLFLNESGFAIKTLRIADDGNHKKRLRGKESESDKIGVNTQWLSLTWVDAQKGTKLVKHNETKHYYTFGKKEFNAKGYELIEYKNIYANVDVQYKLHPNGGLKYSLILHPGAQLKDIQYKYNGVDNLTLDEINNQVVMPIYNDTLIEKDLIAYYENGDIVKLTYSLNNGVITYKSNETIAPNRTLIIDPWVNTLTTLAGLGTPTNQGYDVDWDIQDNLYVYGGGGAISIPSSVAKYDANGFLQWTFYGNLAAPLWYGSPGFVTAGNMYVDKINQKTYVSQGWGTASVIRLDISGNYDNYMTGVNLKEMWDMDYSCTYNKIIGFGGGVTDSNSISLLDTSGVGSSISSCVTGLPDTSQDVACGTTNAAGEVFALYASSGLAANSIYKLNSTYTGHDWHAPTGYSNLVEQGNKPHAVFGWYSNGYNGLAANLHYVYYYDGLYIKCFDGITGAVVGTDTFISGQSPKFQGGIYATECDDVYVGGAQSNIYHFYFNGTSFIPVDTLIIQSQNLATYDLNYNHLNGLFYISGNQFVATIDPQINCPLSYLPLPIQATSYCPDTSVVQVLNADSTKQYHFYWYDSTAMNVVQVSQPPIGITSDTLIGLLLGHTYSVRVIKFDCLLSAETLIINPICTDTIYKCPDEYFVLTNNDTLYNPGLYFDSVINHNIFIINHPVYSFTITDYLCEGDEYNLPGGGGVNQAGIYIDSLSSQYGCDSIYTTILLFAPNYSDTEYVKICPGSTYTLPSSNTVSSAGTYFSQFISEHGCDSTIVTYLSMADTYFVTNSVSICTGEVYTLPSGQLVGMAGTYTDSLISQYGCDSIIVTQLSIVEPPINDMPSLVDLCTGDTIELVANNNTGSQYTWSTGRVGSRIITTVGGVFWVKISAPPCPELYDTVYVNEKVCPCEILLPNAFTPNGDNLNDCFRAIVPPRTTEFHIAIYNRWGQLVYASKQRDFCWDGTINGALGSADTYYFYIKGSGPCGELLHKADVILIR